jgi:electron transport complex protein RnfG
MKVWNTIKLALILMIFATVACVGLAFVYGKTKAVIDRHSKEDLQNAITELFPDADSFDDITGDITSSDSGITFHNEYSVTNNGKIIGAAIQASGGSYGGPIMVLVGVTPNGTISRIKIMSHTDTPGLGANAAKHNYYVDKKKKITFYGQFAGKKVTDPFEAKNDIIAISASTITSTAVSRVARTAGRAAAEWLKAQGAGQ